MCTTKRNKFLTNYTDKENFVTALAAKLEVNGINKVILCPSDADTISNIKGQDAQTKQEKKQNLY